MAKDQTVVLDSPPFATRPDALLPIALAGTSLPVIDARSKCFGRWTFDYDHIDATQWNEARPRIGHNITALFTQERIRYGYWGAETVTVEEPRSEPMAMRVITTPGDPIDKQVKEAMEQLAKNVHMTPGAAIDKQGAMDSASSDDDHVQAVYGDLQASDLGRHKRKR